MPRKPHPAATDLNGPDFDIKSFVRNILLTSPDFSKIYANVLISEGHNPNEAKDIAEAYQKKLGAPIVKIKTCKHIKVTGVRCGSPALREAEFCYFHQRMLHTVKGPKSRLHPFALLEDAAAIQTSVMEVVNGLIRGTLDPKRGELILRALNTAVRNSRRVYFGINTEDMVTRIPEYAESEEPAPLAKTAGETYADAFANRNKPIAEMNAPAPVGPEIAHAKTSATKAKVEIATKPSLTTVHVGTAALGCPGGPASSGRSALAREAASASAAKPAPAMSPARAHVDPTRPKPPSNVKKWAAPKERKIAAHRASGG